MKCGKRAIISLMPAAQEDLASCLRAWRGRISPADAGLPSGSARRVPGLRREEVAALAGLSVDYLARLEQGRARTPSPSIVASLARALRLGDEDRAHLYRLAGHLEPGPGEINRHVPPSLLRLLDRLADTPVMIVDVAGEIVAANSLASALMGDLSSASRLERTIAWRHFTGMPSRLNRTAEQIAESEAAMVTELRDAAARFPEDAHLGEMIAELLRVSPRFAELWKQRTAARAPSRRKTFVHPEIGAVTLDCDALVVQGTDLVMIVYSAPAESPDARALALLGAIGIQSFAAEPSVGVPASGGA